MLLQNCLESVSEWQGFTNENVVDLGSNSILGGDCREVLRSFSPKSIDLILTDPPYFLDGLDGDWRKGRSDSPRATGTIGGLPVGMKFDPRQGVELQKFVEQVAEHWLRVLKPGSFALVFSQPRLSHRMAIALENCGFEIRDLIIWHYRTKSQFKAFSQDHFVERMKLSAEEKAQIKANLGGRRTPQLKGQHETIILAQKPKEGTFVENWLRWQTGLMDANSTLDGTKPSNVMCVEKASITERGRAAEHLTPKPLHLLRHLIELFSKEGQTVLDCFLGSGSTAIAAEQTGRTWIGIEVNPHYVELANQRIREFRNVANG